MTNSWVNYNNQYTTHIRHNHTNSFISGVFYIDGSNIFKTTLIWFPSTEISGSPGPP